MKQHWVHTGSIWKCLNFWWWHNVSTNALGLLWLTLTRNNLCNKREKGDVRSREQVNSSWLLFTFSGQRHVPIYLPLLVDDAMGFFSGYPAMEPQLSYMDHCREIKHVKKNKQQKNRLIYWSYQPLDQPEFNEEWWSGLWEPKMFIRWLLFWERSD